LVFKFFECCAKGGVGREAAGEQILITIVEMLRDLFGDFLLARWREIQGSETAENFGFPVRRFLPP
jgi:hypothetical protein